MDINSTRIIGSLYSAEITQCITGYCEANYVKIISAGSAENQINDIKNYVQHWLSGTKQLATATIASLDSTIHWEACIAPIWTMVQAATTYTGTLAGK